MEKFPRNNIDNSVEREPQSEWADIRNAITKGCGQNIDDILDHYEGFHWGKRTPVPHECLGISSSAIFLSEDIYKNINSMCQFTRNKNLEYPFYFIGIRNRVSDSMSFNQIIYSNNRNEVPLFGNQADNHALAYAKYSTIKEMLKEQREYLEKHNIAGMEPVICVGHTHPFTNNGYWGTTDFGDLQQLMNINSDGGVGNDRSLGQTLRDSTGCKDLSFIQCNIMPNGDVDFVDYDKKEHEFRKIPKAIATVNGIKKPVQSYTFRTPL